MHELALFYFYDIIYLVEILNQVWNLERKEVNMKDGIHPDYKKTVIKCVCGNEIETGSVNDNITVEICSNCHPFYTGQQKILDSEGRVERFNKRYGKKN